MTALHWASSEGHKDTVLLLLQHMRPEAINAVDDVSVII